jgi:cytidyltransferase-like protein
MTDSSNRNPNEPPVRVYVDVICDLFHYGHARFFEKARSLGDQLVVGVCSDEVAMSYKRKPILSLDERIESIRNCRFVDEVLSDPPTPVSLDFLHAHSINFVVHGDDMKPESLQYWYGQAIEAGMFRTIEYSAGISTTDIISRVLLQEL